MRSRPRRGPVRAIVLHTAEGTAASAVAWFRRPGSTVSAHYVVRASDGVVVQLVDEDDVAFHDACFNETTIGIEHEGFAGDPGRWYTPALYEASARLVRDIAARHGLPLDRAHVVGHDEAPDCSEHDDPGPGWDWAGYEHRLRAGEARGGG
ncbi:MAG: N-acetylmuramoyl-L-alanine amidase [Myxococcales bacterium]|nr:MAG: N-acetylmuramoyl-L-alanine amidase [Myxococcales bacterium]